MEVLNYNVVLTIAVLSWFTAQVLKTIIFWVRTKDFSLERMVGAGGMPSCHSATVCSLAIAISRVEKPSSPLFALSIIFAFVVMYDAMGVRRAAGLHARELNRFRKILDEIDSERDEDNTADNLGVFSETPLEKKLSDLENKDLKELLGHTPFEVLGGALLGILIGMAFPIISA